MYDLTKDELLELIDVNNIDNLVKDVNHLLSVAYDDGYCDCMDNMEYTGRVH